MTTPLRSIDIPSKGGNHKIQEWFFSHELMCQFLCCLRISCYADVNGSIRDDEGTIIGLWYFMECRNRYDEFHDTQKHITPREASWLDEIVKPSAEVSAKAKAAFMGPRMTQAERDANDPNVTYEDHGYGPKRCVKSSGHVDEGEPDGAAEFAEYERDQRAFNEDLAASVTFKDSDWHQSVRDLEKEDDFTPLRRDMSEDDMDAIDEANRLADDEADYQAMRGNANQMTDVEINLQILEEALDQAEDTLTKGHFMKELQVQIKEAKKLGETNKEESEDYMTDTLGNELNR